MHSVTDQDDSWTSEDDSEFVTVEVEKRRWIGKRPLDLFIQADETVHDEAAEPAVAPACIRCSQRKKRKKVPRSVGTKGIQ
jgi:hypothetical protein